MGIFIILYTLGGIGLIIAAITMLSVASRIPKTKPKYVLFYIAMEWMFCYGYYLVFQMIGVLSAGLSSFSLPITLVLLFVPMVAALILGVIFLRKAWRNNTYDQAFMSKNQPLKSPVVRRLGLAGVVAIAMTIWIPISLGLMNSLSNIPEESLGLGPFSNLAMTIITMLVSPITAGVVAAGAVICIWKKRNKE